MWTALLRLSQDKVGDYQAQIFFWKFSATHDKNPPGGGSLHLMGSLFLVSIKKDPGTYVTD